MSFLYKNVLVLGATSGIGLALAERMIENGVHIIAVGRRKENLDALQQKHGKEKVSILQFDITDLKNIPTFVESVTKSHPNLDSVFLNSGIQRPIDFTKPESIDLDSVNMEMTTNYISYIHLIKYFLPTLLSQPTPTSLIFNTSGLAIIPIPRCPNYCASKAALHHIILTLRSQLQSSTSKKNDIKIIEILPPAVQTELHDEQYQPDIKNGRSFGMPLDEFTDETWTGLLAGKDDIPIGPICKQYYEAVENERRRMYEGLVKAIHGKH